MNFDAILSAVHALSSSPNGAMLIAAVYYILADAAFGAALAIMGKDVVPFSGGYLADSLSHKVAAPLLGLAALALLANFDARFEPAFLAVYGVIALNEGAGLVDKAKRLFGIAVPAPMSFGSVFTGKVAEIPMSEKPTDPSSSG